MFLGDPADNPPLNASMRNQDKQQKEKIKLVNDSMETEGECVMQVDAGQVSGKCKREGEDKSVKG